MVWIKIPLLVVDVDVDAAFQVECPPRTRHLPTFIDLVILERLHRNAKSRHTSSSEST